MIGVHYEKCAILDFEERKDKYRKKSLKAYLEFDTPFKKFRGWG